MLKNQINGFIAYCKVAGFKNKSIESLSLRINQLAVSSIDPVLMTSLRSSIAIFANSLPITVSLPSMSKRPGFGRFASFTTT